MKKFILPLFLLACPPSPISPATGTDCNTVCAHLRDLQCADGFGEDGGQSCEATCLHAEQHPIVDFQLRCLAAATTVSDAVACGSVSCQ